MSHESKPFLKRIAEEVLKLDVPLENVCILFPNRRAEIFFKKHLTETMHGPQLSPLLLTADDFVIHISGLRLLSGTSLLFEAFEQYRKLPLSVHDSFDSFMKWGNMVLHDINELDRHLVNANDLFENMVSAKTIERWGATTESSYEMINRFLDIWKTFKPLYHALSSHCISNKMGWQGLAYREVAQHPERIKPYLEKTQIKKVVFAGFNALNKAEEKIAEHLLREGIAWMFWDADAYYLEDEFQEAGYFLRERQRKWSRYDQSVFLKGRSLLRNKRISIYAKSGSVEQAKEVGRLLKQDTEARNTAVVLADESLLMPVLSSIPKEIEAVNVTMGMSLKLTQPAAFVLAYLKLKKKRQLKEELYYKDIEKILDFEPVQSRIPFQDNQSPVKLFTGYLKEYNYAFVSREQAFEIAEELNIQMQEVSFLFEEQTTDQALLQLVEVLEAHVLTEELQPIKKRRILPCGDGTKEPLSGNKSK